MELNLTFREWAAGRGRRLTGRDRLRLRAIVGNTKLQRRRETADAHLLRDNR
jgi:hypothetical protein